MAVFDADSVRARDGLHGVVERSEDGEPLGGKGSSVKGSASEACSSAGLRDRGDLGER